MMDALLICLAVASGVTMVVSLSWPALRKYRRLMRRSFRPRYRKTKALLDDVQRQIYQALQGMVGPGLHVFPSVRLCELLDLVGGSESRNPDVAMRICSIGVDFVVCDAKTSRPMLVVELRSPSEGDEEARDRDEFVDQILSAAGLPLLPISRQAPNSSLQLAETVQQSLSAYIKKKSHAA